MTWREFRPDLKGIATTPLDPAIPLDPAREFRPDLKGIATPIPLDPDIPSDPAERIQTRFKGDCDLVTPHH